MIIIPTGIQKQVDVWIEDLEAGKSESRSEFQMIEGKIESGILR